MTNLDVFLALFFDLGLNLYHVGEAYGKFGLQDIEVRCYKKSIALSKWGVVYSKKFRLGIWQWLNLAYSYQKQGKNSDALASCEKAIELDSKFAYSWNVMGGMYADMYRNNEAIFAYQKAIELDPKFADTWGNLGIIYFNLNKYSDAITSYLRFIELEPKIARPWREIGIVYFQKGDNEKALDAFRQAIKLEPENCINQMAMGVLLRYVGREVQALEYIERANMLKEKEPDNYILACTESISGNVAETIQLLKIVLENKDTHVGWLRQALEFYTIHDDPHFKELVNLK